MAIHSCSLDDDDPEKAREHMRALIGPGHADQAVRNALQMVWMALPEDKKNTPELRRQMERLLERAIKDMEEDSQEFGM